MLLWIILGFFTILGMIVSAQLKAKFKKFSKQLLSSGLSGKEVAERMLADNGLHKVDVISVPGKLTDHYNPANRTVNLSPDVYNGRSLSAIGVACHEAGHALQHAQSYAFLNMRSAMCPLVGIGNQVGNICK